MQTETSAERLSFLSNPVDGFIHPNSKDRWDINDSTFEDYFYPVELEGHPEEVLDVLVDQIGLSEDNVGIDIGGGTNGVAIRGLIEYGLLGRGIVTNMKDRRDEAVKNDPTLEHIEGDILNGRTWKKICSMVEESTSEGLALVMHRPVGGMQDFSSSFYNGALHNILDMIRPGGAMFTQVPGALLDGLREHRKLQGICQSIKERPDVSEILPSETTGHKNPKYAVILMGQK